MVQAAAGGVIDFSKANFRDPSWWRRLYVLLGCLKIEHNYKLADARHRHHLAAMLVSSGDAKSAMAAAVESYTDMQGAMHPWYNAAMQEKNANEELREAWIEAFGDPSTPLVAEEIENTARNMLASGEVDEETRSPEDDGFVAWIRSH